MDLSLFKYFERFQTLFVGDSLESSKSQFTPPTPHDSFVASSDVTIIFGPPGKHSLHSLITVLIHNSGHFGPFLPFWAPGPPALPGLPMASYATGRVNQAM